MAEEFLDKKNGTVKEVYEDTRVSLDKLLEDKSIFSQILEMMKDGKSTIKLSKRYLLRAMDEMWITMIEDSLPALDAWIRSPSKTIEEIEEVLPIELSRNISPRSLQHLSQHTNYISKIEGDNITPTKILNVRREETMLTYENKFVNTLINRLYIFVNRRYEIILKEGQDEKKTELEMVQDFSQGDIKGKIKLTVELSEANIPEAELVVKNYTKGSELWRRVIRLNSIVSSYASSDFVNQMGKVYIRPPVMRTNAILKNKNLRQCLELWRFIESYDGAGFSMLVEENLEKVSDEYIKELYQTLAVQYLMFRYNVNNDFEMDQTLASETSAEELHPKFIDEIQKREENEYNINPDEEEKKIPIPSMTKYGTLTPEDKMMLEVLDVALEAVDYFRVQNQKRYFAPAQIPEPDPMDEYPENLFADEIL